MKAGIPTVLLCLCLLFATSEAESKWSYKDHTGPVHWSHLSDAYSQCASGHRQSPIDIATSGTKYRTYPKLTLTSVDLLAFFEFRNDGVSIAAVPQPDATKFYLGGGPLGSDRYQLFNMHMHFGNSSFKSSEHGFNGARTTGELHIVFYNAKYGSLNKAIASKSSTALAVIGILFDTCREETAHPGLTTMINRFSDLKYHGDKAEKVIQFSNFLGSMDMDQYYTYNGSLTTPGCNEQVTWLVMDEILHITPATANLLSRLLTGSRSDVVRKHMAGNARPFQRLSGRTVARNFMTYGMGSGSSRLSTSACLQMIATVLVVVMMSYV